MDKLNNLGVFVSFGFYLSILAIMFLYLSLNVVATRRSLKITLGDGGNQMVLRAMRAQANFAEYVPFAVILILAVSQLTMLLGLKGNTMSGITHTLFFLLIIARLSHMYGMLHQETQVRLSFSARMIGTLLTYGVIGISALVLMLNWIYALAANIG